MQAVEDAFEQACQDGTIPGAVLLAETQDGSFKYARAFGYKNLRTREPMTIDTSMAIASCTKLLTTVCVLQLFQNGKLTPETDVLPYLPELERLPVLQGFDSEGKPKTRPRKAPTITVRQLITHTNGGSYEFLSAQLQRYWPSVGKKSPALASTVPVRAGSPLLAEPGGSWLYGMGLDWAGKLVEFVTGTDLDSYMRQHIFDPLRIPVDDIGFWPERHPQLKARLASMAMRSDPEGRVEFTTIDPMNRGSTDAFGGHGLYATIPAYMTVLRSIIDRSDERLLDRHWKEEMFRPQIGRAAEDQLNEVLRDPTLSAAIVGELPADRVRYSWGYGGLLSLQDDKGWRRKGTLLWSGYPNLLWYCDRATGLCLMYGGQVIPPGDMRVQNMMTLFEKAVYARVGKLTGKL